MQLWKKTVDQRTGKGEGVTQSKGEEEVPIYEVGNSRLNPETLQGRKDRMRRPKKT